MFLCKCDLGLFHSLFKLSYLLRDYNYRCFKILNSYYLFAKQKNNYIREHKKDKDFNINKFYKQWLEDGCKYSSIYQTSKETC